jgi:hypothetical protein
MSIKSNLKTKVKVGARKLSEDSRILSPVRLSLQSIPAIRIKE